MTDPSSIRVLVLEDSPQDVFLLRAALAKVPLAKVELLHAERLCDALSLLEQHAVDLVLTDLNLPDSMGLETVSELVGKASGVPVVVLAGYNPPEAAKQLTQAGASGCISKDRFDCPALSRVVADAMQRKQV
jgi:DNA-binding NarL/FixJ family response regulator